MQVWAVLVGIFVFAIVLVVTVVFVVNYNSGTSPYDPKVVRPTTPSTHLSNVPAVPLSRLEENDRRVKSYGLPDDHFFQSFLSVNIGKNIPNSPGYTLVKSSEDPEEIIEFLKEYPTAMYDNSAPLVIVQTDSAAAAKGYVLNVWRLQPMDYNNIMKILVPDTKAITYIYPEVTIPMDPRPNKFSQSAGKPYKTMKYTTMQEASDACMEDDKCGSFVFKKKSMAFEFLEGKWADDEVYDPDVDTYYKI